MFLLLHEAKEVRLSGDTYWVMVEEMSSGFQQIQFSNLLFPEDTTEEYPELDHTVVIVDMQGKELARAESGGVFDEAVQDEVQTTTATPEATEIAEP